MEEQSLSTREKARMLNLQHNAYGSFAEIGAGQEVAAFFFKAGGASNTIAKTMSAYDMTFSNAIYGVEKSGRYVCEPRLIKMLNREYDLIEQRLGEKIGDERPFFSFANTVTTINYAKTSQGHGWVGLKFQLQPNTPPNQAIIHVKMHDNDTLTQQHAVGMIGVNLIYACYYHYNEPEQLLISLLDGLSSDRIEIDMIHIEGPDFAHADNRILSLQLVKNGLTNAAVFGPNGQNIEPRDLFYKKNILALRGRFRPMTLVNMDMLRCGKEQFIHEKDVEAENVIPIAELTLNDLSNQEGNNDIDYKDFLDRVDILGSLGLNVMISNYYEYYRLVAYLSQLTRKKIGIVLGVYNLEMIFDEKYYEKLSGGILESFSTLFSRNVKLYVYPSLYRDSTSELYTCINFELPNHLTDLYEYLLANHKIDDITDFDKTNLNIISDSVLQYIKEGKSGWEQLVPTKVVEAIKERNLFGYSEGVAVSADFK